MHLELSKQLEAATVAFTRTVAENFAAEGIYGVALYTSGCYRYVFGTFLTYKGLEEVSKEYLKEDQYQEEWQSVDNAMRELKWSPCDSPHYCKYDNLFKDVNQLIDTIWSNVIDDDNEYILTCQEIHQACIDALAKVRKSQIFRDDVVLVLLMGDQSNEERLLNAEGLNPEKTLNNFKSELQIDEQRLLELRNNRWDW